MKIKGIFTFHELARPEILTLGERRVITVPTTNGPAPVEIGLMVGDRTDIEYHIQPFFRNLGSGIFTELGETDQVVHPKRVAVSLQEIGKDPDITSAPYVEYNRRTKGACLIQAGDRQVSLRDAWCKEPTASFHVLEDLYIICLNDTGPYKPFPAKYHKTIDPDKPTRGEDPMSLYAHRLRGGMGNMWDIYIDKDLLQGSQLVPQPGLSATRLAEVRQLASMTYPDTELPIPQRLMKILGSMDHVQEGSFAWYFFRGTDRFLNWKASSDLFDVSDEAQNIGWNTFGDLFWAEGNYNLGYDWLLTAGRMWLFTQDPFWWDVFVRFAQWAAMQGLCWSGDRRGMQWYEKGSRGYEVGSDYWPSSYKQFSEGLLLAYELIGPSWWLQDALDAHLTAMDTDCAGLFSGDWGERIAGWKMMNAATIYKYTKREEFRQHAILQAQNYLDLCRLRVHMAEKLPDKWKDPHLGIPFCPNSASTPKYQSNSWAVGKVAKGLIYVNAWCGPPKELKESIHNKVIQMADFMASELIRPGPVLQPVDRFTPDLVPAKYLGGYISVNHSGDPESCLSWMSNAIGYGAVHGVNSCEDILEQLVTDYCTYPEVPITSITADGGPWSGVHTKIKSAYNNYFIDGVDCEDVTTNHEIRLSYNGVETQHPIVTAHTDKDPLLSYIEFTDPENCLVYNSPDTLYNWVVTGPVRDGVRSMGDYAIRIVDPLPFNIGEYIDKDFNWSNGQHYNTWFKNIGAILYQWDSPAACLKMLQDRQERESG